VKLQINPRANGGKVFGIQVGGEIAALYTFLLYGAKGKRATTTKHNYIILCRAAVNY